MRPGRISCKKATGRRDENELLQCRDASGCVWYNKGENGGTGKDATFSLAAIHSHVRCLPIQPPPPSSSFSCCSVRSGRREALLPLSLVSLRHELRKSANSIARFRDRLEKDRKNRFRSAPVMVEKAFSKRVYHASRHRKRPNLHPQALRDRNNQMRARG